MGKLLFYYFHFILSCIVLASLEIYQHNKGKPIDEVLYEIISYFSIFFIFSFQKSGFLSLIHLMIFYEFFEAASWKFFQKRIDDSLLSLIRFESIELYPGLSDKILILIFFYFLFMFFFGQLNIFLKISRRSIKY